jgi:hypothetical protein
VLEPVAMALGRGRPIVGGVRSTKQAGTQGGVSGLLLTPNPQRLFL